jgi:predicted ATPase/class 3 adenylate cyclase
MEFAVRTFVLTDLVGSTELWDIDSGGMSRALDQHDDLVAHIVDEAGGELIRTKGEGDSTFSVFTDTVAAVEAAERIAFEVASYDWLTPRPLSVRVGVHVGPAQRRGDNWFGSTVNRAARLRGLASGGAVLISTSVASAVRDSPGTGARLELLGRRKLRGFRDREDIWAVVPAGVDPPALEPDRGDMNLESPAHELLGRDEGVDELEELLKRRRLVTVTGAGGSGKTRLAVEVALRTRQSYADGVWMVDLSAAEEGGVLPLVLSSAGCASTALSTVEAFALKETLIVLDNCEHVLDDSAQTCASLLRAAPGVTVLATSRKSLGLSAEATHPLRPLAMPPTGTSVTDLDSYASVKLFVERARSVDPSFAVRPADREAMVRCMALLEGLPLAIEIAASQIKTMSLPRLADTLERELPALRSNWRDAAERHRSVAATIDWSLKLLDPSDCSVVEELSVCRGFDAETVADVTDTADVERTLRDLVDASLVVSLGGDRFRLLEPIRQHAFNRLVARGDVDRRKEALARHLMDRITELTRRMFVDPLARPALRAEAGNIEQSMTWLLENQRIDEAIRLVGLLGTYWFSHDQSTGLRWISRIEPHLDVCNAGTAAPARMVLGMHRQQTADECAIPQLTAALAAFTAQGRRRGAASAAFFLGRELGMDGRSNAKETLLTAVRMAREADEPLLVSWSLTWLGILANRAGSNREAERYFLEALDVSHAAGMADSMGEAFAGLAHVALFENSLDRARVLADRSVAASRRSADDFQLAAHLKTRAEICVEIGDLLQATLDITEAGPLAIEIGDEIQIDNALAIAAAVLDALRMKKAALEAVAPLGDWLAYPYHGWRPIVQRIRALAQQLSEADLAEPPSIRGTLNIALGRLADEPT